jgi:hypothetical protein
MISDVPAPIVKCQGDTLASFLDQAEIFLPGNPGRVEIVVNDRDRNFIVSGNYHRSENARFDVRAVTTLLAGKSETYRQKYFLQGVPVYGRYFGHDQTFAIVECLSTAIQVGEIHAPSWFS